MANLTRAAGNNGVSGTNDDLTGSLGTYSAIRTSVSCTEGGTYSLSDVQSVTKNLRSAYTGVECDSPAIVLRT